MQDLNLKRNNSQRPRRGKDADPGIAEVEDTRGRLAGLKGP